MRPNRIRSFSIAIVATASLALPASAFGGVDAFLTIPDYSTTTSDSAMSAIKGSMEINSWGFKITRSAPASGVSGGSAKAALNVVTITKPIDANSPRISTDLASGAIRSSATITVRAGSPRSALVRYCFSNIVFSEYTIANTAGSPDRETIGFSPAGWVMSFIPRGQNGDILAPVKAGWNLTLQAVAGSKPIADC